MAGDSSTFGVGRARSGVGRELGSRGFRRRPREPAGVRTRCRRIARRVSASSLLVAVALLIGESVPAPGSLGWAVLAGASGSMGLLALYTALASGRMGIAAPVSGVVGAVVPVLVGAALHGSPGPSGSRGSPSRWSACGS